MIGNVVEEGADDDNDDGDGDEAAQGKTSGKTTRQLSVCPR